MHAFTVADNLLHGFVDFVERLDMKPMYASPVSEDWRAKHGEEYRLYEWDDAIVNLLRDRPVPVTFFFADEGDYTLAVMCFTSPTPTDEERRRAGGRSVGTVSAFPMPAATVEVAIISERELRGSDRYRALAR